MLYSFLVYFIAISLGAMYEFLFIFGFVLIGFSFLLTIAHLKNNRKLRIFGKVGNVILTIVGFVNIFISDLNFSDFSI